jgi:hypothetical protein
VAKRNLVKAVIDSLMEQADVGVSKAVKMEKVQKVPKQKN